MKKINLTLLSLLLLVSTVNAQTMTTWNADKAHSTIGFKVKHMVISEVSGKFGDYDLKVVTNGSDFSGAQVEVVLKTASIDTDNEGRDNHLKSDDFLNAAF